MTQEDKELLLKDLCARLPYGVKINIKDDYSHKMVDDILCAYHIGGISYNLESRNLKPYLRPMSSMTEEEEILFRCELPAIAKTDAQLVAMRMELFLKGHLDFNHLIESGLALEAPKDMYKTE